METLNQFSIPIEGLKDGMHQFDFRIDREFFNHFDQSPVQDGNFDLVLYFDKRPDLLVLTFDFDGSLRTNCDRCLEEIRLPIKGNDQLIVKYASETGEEAEVIYLTKGTSHLNVAKYIYEFICLAIPMVKVYDCGAEANPPCNMEILNQLYQHQGDTDENESDNPVWEALKNLEKNTGLSEIPGSEN